MRALPARMAGDAARGRALYDELVAGLPPPPPVKLASELNVQTLPDGALDFTHLAWFERTHRQNVVWEALIPECDVQRFLDGEAARCESDKYTKCGDTGKYCLYKCPCAGERRAPVSFGPRNEHVRGSAQTHTTALRRPYKTQSGLIKPSYKTQWIMLLLFTWNPPYRKKTGAVTSVHVDSDVARKPVFAT